MIVVAALIGAGFVSAQGAPVAAKALAPVLSEQIEARFDKAVQELLPSGTEAGEEEAAGYPFPPQASTAEQRMTWRVMRWVR